MGIGGTIDIKGNWIIKPLFNAITYSQGFYMVRFTHKIGYMNSQANWVINPYDDNHEYF